MKWKANNLILLQRTLSNDPSPPRVDICCSAANPSCLPPRPQQQEPRSLEAGAGKGMFSMLSAAQGLLFTINASSGSFLSSAEVIPREEHVRYNTETLTTQWLIGSWSLSLPSIFHFTGIHKLPLIIFKGALQILLSVTCLLPHSFSSKKCSSVVQHLSSLDI